VAVVVCVGLLGSEICLRVSYFRPGWHHEASVAGPGYYPVEMALQQPAGVVLKERIDEEVVF